MKMHVTKWAMYEEGIIRIHTGHELHLLRTSLLSRVLTQKS